MGKETYTYCSYSNCTKRPIFAYQHMKPLFCSSHKEQEMIDVKNRKCEFSDCIVQPIFGYEG